MKLFYVLIFMYFYIDYMNNHVLGFRSILPQTNHSSPCDDAKVEHFFNLVFSEFQNHAPVCVCIQLCTEHATFCYPKGCFRKLETTDDDTQRGSSQKHLESTPPVSVLMGEPNDFLNRFQLKNKTSTKNDQYAINRNIFRDRYQSMFKYKKNPNVHLRYNIREQVKNPQVHLKYKIREQVKNMISDVIRLSKRKVPEHTDKYYSDIVLDNGSNNFESKYLKRDFSNIFKPRSVIRFTSEETNDNSSVSLESFFESVIGPVVNGSELALDVNVDLFINNVTSTEITTIAYKKNFVDNNVVDKIVGNLKRKKHTDGSKNILYKNAFNKMITTISKQIDKINNSSKELMEHVYTNQTLETKPQSGPTSTFSNAIFRRNHIEYTTEKSAEPTQAHTKKELRLNKKSHQRLNKNLRNRKIN